MVKRSAAVRGVRAVAPRPPAWQTRLGRSRTRAYANIGHRTRCARAGAVSAPHGADWWRGDASRGRDRSIAECSLNTAAPPAASHH